MPASIAFAIGLGIFAISRPRAGHSPTSTMSSAVTTNAATASENCPVIPAVATSNAAPGVLQANLTGTRNTMLTTIDSRPWMRQITSSPDAACDWVAPTATRPASTIANELEKPVMAATIPAISVGRWVSGLSQGQRGRLQPRCWAVTVTRARRQFFDRNAALPGPAASVGQLGSIDGAGDSRYTLRYEMQELVNSVDARGTGLGGRCCSHPAFRTNCRHS